MDMPKEDNRIDFNEPIKTAPKEVQRIILQVLKLERERLYENQPKLNSDIINIIRKEIK
jgi:hypothetical protein